MRILLLSNLLSTHTIRWAKALSKTHDILSYGFIGALSGFHPFIISVWGSDVYDFPYRSIFHKILLKHNLSKADIILSTSHAMADQVRKFTHKNILVTPFGIDLKRFSRNR